MALRNVGKLEKLIEHNRAVNLVIKLQRDLDTCIEGKSLRTAATIAEELAAALRDLATIHDRQFEEQEDLALQHAVEQIELAML